MSISLNYAPARNIQFLGQDLNISLGLVEQSGLLSIIQEIKKYPAITAMIAKNTRFFLSLFMGASLHHQSLGSIPLDCNSFLTIRFNQAAKDSSPSCACASSIIARNSGSNLNWKGGLPRLSFLCVDTLITPIVMCLCVITHYIHICKKAMPCSARTHTGHLTSNDKYTIEEAMKDHITPVTGRNSHTPKNCFNWRFFSCQQFKYFTVTAHTEQEARSMLPDSPCLFSARIPAKAVAHV